MLVSFSTNKYEMIEYIGNQRWKQTVILPRYKVEAVSVCHKIIASARPILQLNVPEVTLRVKLYPLHVSIFLHIEPQSAPPVTFSMVTLGFVIVPFATGM